MNFFSNSKNMMILMLLLNCMFSTASLCASGAAAAPYANKQRSQTRLTARGAWAYAQSVRNRPETERVGSNTPRELELRDALNDALRLSEEALNHAIITKTATTRESTAIKAKQLFDEADNSYKQALAEMRKYSLGEYDTEELKSFTIPDIPGSVKKLRECAAKYEKALEAAYDHNITEGIYYEII